MAGLPDPRAIDAHAVKLIFARLGTKFFDVLCDGIRLQQRVVNVAASCRGESVLFVHNGSSVKQRFNPSNAVEKASKRLRR